MIPTAVRRRIKESIALNQFCWTWSHTEYEH